MVDWKMPTAVVVHDAGATNLIIAWLKVWGWTVRVCAQGPSLNLWEQAFPGQPIWTTPEAAIDGCASLLTGTGWGSALEHNARILAREHAIRSIAVIDHWTNYAERFIRNGEQVLPDEIWVSDLYSEELARVSFPTVRVLQQVNAYQESLMKEVKFLQLPTETLGNERVLYVLEPIRDLWGQLAEPGEFLALDYFMTHRQRANISANAEIRLRPHPSDPPGKYDAWLARNSNSRVSLDQSRTLAESLAWSSVVAGCQTYAMAMALACGRTVISTNPAWAPPCILPHKEIIRLAIGDENRLF